MIINLMQTASGVAGSLHGSVSNDFGRYALTGDENIRLLSEAITGALNHRLGSECQARTSVASADPPAFLHQKQRPLLTCRAISPENIAVKCFSHSFSPLGFQIVLDEEL